MLQVSTIVIIYIIHNNHDQIDRCLKKKMEMDANGVENRIFDPSISMNTNRISDTKV